MQKTSVLIVGAGPTGLMMACQLALHKVPFLIVEKESGPTTESRALGIQARSLEIFDQMGIADKFTKEGKPATGLNFLANGKKVQHVPLSGLGTGLTKFPFLLTLEQSRTEAFLLEFLKSHGQKILWNTTVTAFTQDEQQVVTTLQNKDGNAETITADWIIGADGAHSVVRHILGIPLEGKTYPQSLFVLDCKIASDLSSHDITVATSDEAFAAFFPMTNNRWRIVGEAPESTRGKDTITFAEVEKDLGAKLRLDLTLSDPAWIALYKAHHRCVSHFQEKRAFLLGDAANIHSPIGAQGMNTGLQDAYNLAWKLAFVYHKKAPAEILETYNTERLPFAKRLVETTDRLFNLFVSNNFAAVLLREHVLPFVVKNVISHKKSGQMGFRTVSQIGISYHRSPLTQTDSNRFPKIAPKPGDRLPYFLFKQDDKETNIQKMITPQHFHLLLFSDSESFCNTVKEAITPYQNSIKITQIPQSSETKELYMRFGITDSGYYLVRPDMYIASRGTREDDARLPTYLAQVLKRK